MRRIAGLTLLLLIAGVGACRPSPEPPSSSSLAPTGPVRPTTPTQTQTPSPIDKPPEFHQQVRTNAYRVGGLTPSAIQRQIDARGPGQWAGRTSYAVTYGFTSRRVGARCFARDIWVKVTVDITLPTWEHAGDASAATAQFWHAIITTLRRHERGHVKIAEATARQVTHTLAHLQGASTCDAIDAAVTARAKHLIHRGQEQQRAYDARTSHGLNQWAA